MKIKPAKKALMALVEKRNGEWEERRQQAIKYFDEMVKDGPFTTPLNGTLLVKDGKRKLSHTFNTSDDGDGDSIDVGWDLFENAKGYNDDTHLIEEIAIGKGLFVPIPSYHVPAKY